MGLGRTDNFRISENNLKIAVLGPKFDVDPKKARIRRFGAYNTKL